MVSLRTLSRFAAVASIATMVGVAGCAKDAKPAPVGDAAVDAPNGRVTGPEESPEPATPRVIRGPRGVEITQVAGEVLAVLDVRGIPYAEMGDEIARLRLLLDRQGIVTDARARAIYVDDPALVDGTDYRFRVAVSIAADAYPRPPLHRVVREPAVIARVTHRGDFDEAYQVRCYETVPLAIRAMGFTVVGPIEEVYRFSATDTDPSQWETEVRYPVAPIPGEKTPK